MKSGVKLAAVVLAMAIAAFAQHGAHGGGGVSHGAPGMGSGSGVGEASSSGHSGGKPDSVSSGSMGKQSPDQILSRNTKLSSNLDKLLPNGMTAQQACSGFKNLGQCVAAIHVSHNLGIPFEALKNKTTGDGTESLGKAIHDLKPDVDSKAEVKKANKQAQQDMDDSNS